MPLISILTPAKIPRTRLNKEWVKTATGPYVYLSKPLLITGSGCGSVSRAVASDTRDPQFVPCIGKVLSTKFSTNFIIEKTKIKKKRPGMAHL